VVWTGSKAGVMLGNPSPKLFDDFFCLKLRGAGRLFWKEAVIQLFFLAICLSSAKRVGVMGFSEDFVWSSFL
jgi:hypothetical protein